MESEILSIAKGVVNVRRKIWVATYPNPERGISEEDIHKCLRPFEEDIENTTHTIKEESQSRQPL